MSNSLAKKKVLDLIKEVSKTWNFSNVGYERYKISDPDNYRRHIIIDVWATHTLVELFGQDGVRLESLTFKFIDAWKINWYLFRCESRVKQRIIEHQTSINNINEFLSPGGEK